MKSADFAALFEKTLSAKRVEPQQRKVGGIYKHAIHRFPIKGGITLRDVMRENMAQTNALFREFARRQVS